MASVPMGSQTVGINGADFSDLVPLAADVYLRNDGGRFLTETTGNYALTPAGAAQINAWGSDCFQIIRDGNQGSTPYPTTTTYSAGTKFTTVTHDMNNPRFGFWIPSDDTLIAANVNLKCELIIIGATTAAVQKVKPSVTTTPLVQIDQVDLINNYALVHVL